MTGDIIGMGLVLAFMLVGVTSVILMLKDKADK